MLRGSLDSEAAHASLLLRNAGDAHTLRFVYRSDGGARSRTRVISDVLDDWVRLERRGNDLIASSSVDGIIWIERESTNFALPQLLFAGIALTAADTQGELNTAFVEVSNIELSLPPGVFRRGDCDGTVEANVTDALFLLGSVFSGEGTLPCRAACDVDGDGGSVGVVDAVYLVRFLFLGGATPVPPFPSCGKLTPRDERLGCEEFPAECSP
jgi:hypothetical protein